MARSTSVPIPLMVLASLALFLVACGSLSPVAKKTEPSSRPPTIRATFLGQDGADYAGRSCEPGDGPDNVHVHLEGLEEENPAAYQVEDREGGGVWATPCNPISHWLLYVTSPVAGEAELYFKPFRDAPQGTLYTVTVMYQDGSTQSAAIEGSRVELNP